MEAARAAASMAALATAAGAKTWTSFSKSWASVSKWFSVAVSRAPATAKLAKTGTWLRDAASGL